MISQCKKCGGALPPAAIECPKCKTFHPENIPSAVEAAAEEEKAQAPQNEMLGFPSSQAMAAQAQKLKLQIDQLRSDKDNLALDIANLTIRQVKGWFSFWKLMMIFTVVMTFGCAFLVYRIYTGTDHFISGEVSKQLVNPVFNETVAAITTTELKQKMDKLVGPVVDEFKAGVTELRHELQASKTEFDLKYEQLSGEVQIMNDRRHLLKLADHAILGSHRAYKELLSYRETAPLIELTQLASAQIAQVEAHYENKSPLLDVHVNYQAEDGKGFIDDEVPTEPLIEVMLNSPHWKVRVKAAELLGRRVEVGVPEFLLTSAGKDPMLDVVKQALRSFSATTGYVLEKPLSVEAAAEWWQSFSPSSIYEDSEVEVYEIEAS